MNALESLKVSAAKSIDFFEAEFTTNEQPLQQLNNIKKQLFGAKFDAILFTKVICKERSVNVIDSYQSFANKFQTFEDYLGNQHFYSKNEEVRYQVYTTETSLFCICSEKERDVLWRTEIEVAATKKATRNIN
ncbi:hypothetical protein ES044_11615 [Polaribacter sp. IC066]|uniref:hypothetical protein n=1 Tax=Polaribacter sp. IC066 TaxID=57032 RepID=UPI0011BD681A|nr:hypothetical protein [Polaribacter sp. IC066]TXD58652.1 hypothetical protein ES044_11615 [Polaribacter sp. IC066]